MKMIPTMSPKWTGMTFYCQQQIPLQVSESNCGGLDYLDDCVQGQNFIVVCRLPFVFSHVVSRTHTYVLFFGNHILHLGALT